MYEVLVNRLGGLSLPRKSVVRLTDRPDMTLDVYRGRKTTIQPTIAPVVDINLLTVSQLSAQITKVRERIISTVMCLSIGTPKIINFPFFSNAKLIIIRCPKIKVHDSLIMM